MALDPTSQDPCSVLNAASYPTLWFPTTAPVSVATFNAIANGGSLKTYVASLSALGASGTTNDVLVRAQGQSSFRLLQFLSGVGVAALDSTKKYTQLGGIILGTPAAPESIVDTYIVGAQGLNKGTSYTFSRPTAPLVTPANLWTAGDDVAATPQSLLGKLIKKGYLLSQSQVYLPSDFASANQAAAPQSGSESLVYLYEAQQQNTITPAQTTRVATLEATNLKFFAAFLCEYCFYRTRYEWLLTQYFNVYTQSATAYSATTNGPFFTNLYGTGRAYTPIVAGTTSTASSMTQADYLAGLSYQMACLNTRMTDMRSLLGVINTYYSGVFTTLQSQLNASGSGSASAAGSTAGLNQSITALSSSAEDASRYLTDQDFKKGVMEYNSQKNRYSNVLLGFYAFLNIAALAAVYQLARS